MPRGSCRLPGANLRSKTNVASTSLPLSLLLPTIFYSLSQAGQIIFRKMADEFYSNPEAMLRSLGMGAPGGFPMPEIVTPASVRKQRDERVANIFKNFRLLHDILKRYESTIQKRWLKKTKEQKRRILLAYWGGTMPAKHRADFEAFTRLRDAGGSGAAGLRPDFMWPFINQEDLTKPKVYRLK